MTHTFLWKFHRDDGSPVYIEYTVSRYYPATQADQWGPGEPAEGGEIEIVRAFDGQYPAVKLTDEEQDWMHAHLVENHEVVSEREWHRKSYEDD